MRNQSEINRVEKKKVVRQKSKRVWLMRYGNFYFRFFKILCTTKFEAASQKSSPE